MEIKGKKVSKIFIVVFLVLAIVIPILMRSCSINNGNYKNDSMEAKEYTLDLVVDDYGNMHVVETIVIDNYVDRYNNYFYKEIAYNKNNMFGNSALNKSSLKKDAKLIVKEGNKVVFDSDTSENVYPNHFVGFSYENDRDERGYTLRCENNVRCDTIFYYNRSGFAEITTFVYEYTIEGVITQYKDISELNWVLLDYQPFKFNNITINMTLPEGEYNIAEEKTFFHGTNMAKRKFVDDNKIVITAKDMISDEQIEVRLLLDNEVFSNVRDINKVNINAMNEILAFEKEQTKIADQKFFIGNSGVIIVFALFVVLLLIITIVCYKKHDKELKSEFYNEYYRELPAEYSPAVMGYLYKFREIDDDDLTATLLDLIRRKYLILDSNGSSGVNDKNPDYKIKLNKEKSQNDLTESEKYLIRWFIKEIGNGEEVSSLQLSAYCDSYTGAKQYQESSRVWYGLVKSEASKYKFFEKNLSNVKVLYSIIGILLGIATIIGLSIMVNYSGYSFGAGLIFSASSLLFSYVLYVNSIDRRTKSGNEDFVRWRAFKKFLEDFSSFEDYPVPSIIIWEHYLVYATSFGIADKVSEQLKLKFNLEEISSVDTTFVVYFGLGHHRIGRFNRTIRGMKSMSATTIARYTAQRTSSSFGGRSGGGGFSGGSSFGGGGGSFGGGRR